MSAVAPYPAEGQVWIDIAKSKASKRRHKATILFVIESEDPHYCKYSPPSKAAVTYRLQGRVVCLSMRIERFLETFAFLE